MMKNPNTSDLPTEGRDTCITCNKTILSGTGNLYCNDCFLEGIILDKPIPHTVDTGKTAEKEAFRRNPYLNDLHRRGRSEFIAGAEWQSQQPKQEEATTIKDLKKQINELQSKLATERQKVTAMAKGFKPKEI